MFLSHKTSATRLVKAFFWRWAEGFHGMDKLLDTYIEGFINLSKRKMHNSRAFVSRMGVGLREGWGEGR